MCHKVPLIPLTLASSLFTAQMTVIISWLGFLSATTQMKEPAFLEKMKSVRNTRINCLLKDLALATDSEGLATGGKEQQQLPMPTKNLFFDGKKLTVWRGR